MKTSVKTFVLSFLFLGLISCGNANASEKHPKKKNTIKVALLLDTSGSMSGLINQAKAQLWEIVNELSYAKCGNDKPNLEIALYEYGNDRISSESGFIRKVLHFSTDLDEISERLFSLTTNGGSEYCGKVIQTSINELEWGKNKGDLKMIFIAGNEPFTQGNVFYKDAITNAKENDVVVNTIFCGDYRTGVSGMWQDGAAHGNGDYMTINHNKKIVHVVTPYDDEIIILNKRLNKTYVYYGNKGASKFASQYTQDMNAETLDEVVVVKRAVSKSSRLYNNKNWDLVDAEKEADFNYSKIKKKELPKELQGKSTSEIKKYVKSKSEERAKIQKEIKELDKKRRAFVTKKQQEKTNKDELNSVMINAIKKQAKKKSYTW